MKKFEFKKPIEEIEVADKTYNIDFSDEKLKEYQKEFNHFYKQTKEIEAVKSDNLSDDEQLALMDQTKELVRKFIDKLLGEGSFDEIYEASGKSLINLIEFVAFLGEIIGERSNKLRNENRNKYLKKVKKK